MYEDLLQNINYLEGLYLYGSGEMDQLSPLKENTEEGKEIFETSVPRKIPLHFISKTETIKLIKCGAMSTIILSTEGNVYTFGCADNGALGHEESISAKRVPLKFAATGISGGDCHGLAYNRENLAFWGQFRNRKGNIGKPCIEPFYFNNNKIQNEFYKKAISGTNHVIILTEKKNVFSFGNNEFGQAGIIPKINNNHFQINKINEKNVEDIFTGDEHSFLIKYEYGNKILKSWGLNNNGQLGIGSYPTNNEQNSIIYVPTKVIFHGLSNISIKKVTGGSSTSLCLSEDNRVFVWGLNDFSLLGIKSEKKIIPSPKEIIFFNPYSNPNNEVDDIYSNYQYFYAKNSKTNRVYSWGSGESYILGNRKEKAETTPYLINHLFFKNLYVNCLALGSFHVAVLLTEKKDLDLSLIKEQTKEKDQVEISKSNMAKPRKRKTDEISPEKIEKNENFGILVKVQEEYITLNENDQPKASVKKFISEKKIISKKIFDNNGVVENVKIDEKEISKKSNGKTSITRKSNLSPEREKEEKIKRQTYNKKEDINEINDKINKKEKKELQKDKTLKNIDLRTNKFKNDTKEDKNEKNLEDKEKLYEKSSSKNSQKKQYPLRDNKEDKKKESKQKNNSKNKKEKSLSKEKDKDKEKIEDEDNDIYNKNDKKRKQSSSKSKNNEKKIIYHKKEDDEDYSEEEENEDSYEEKGKNKKKISSKSKSNKKSKNEIKKNEENYDNKIIESSRSKRNNQYTKNIQKASPEKKETRKSKNKNNTKNKITENKSKSKEKKYPKNRK